MLRDRLSLSAILIGIAFGFRPTSGLFIIPVIVHALLENRPWRAIARAVMTAIAIGIVSYLPALIKYGIPNSYRSMALDAITQILIGGYNFLSFLGILQTVVLFVALSYFIWKGKTKYSSFILFHTTNIAIWIALFVFLPDEPAYLLPVLPSLVLLFDRLARKRAYLGMAVLMLSYHVVQIDLMGDESGNRFIKPSIQPGFTILDIRDRLFKLSTRRAATEYVSSQPTVLMLGASWIPASNEKWVHDLEYNMDRQGEGNLFVSSRIRDENVLRGLKEKGFRLVVWNDAKWEYLRTGNTIWRNYAEVVYDLDEFFGTHIIRRTKSQR